ncbi:MAG: hypothetical protein QOG28_2730, partial [Trebonia sp.]|nr:hypothetical protein [Trebonia sp.]
PPRSCGMTGHASHGKAGFGSGYLQAGYVTGQVIRAIGEDISLMQGWTRKVTVSSGGKRWDATKLGQVMATDIFGSRAPGLRLGS